jgi:predicted small lipoprotein YifL
MRNQFLTLALVSILAPAAWCGDTVPLDQVPAAVKATALKESKNGTVESVEKIAGKDGHPAYVVHVKNGDKQTTYTIGEDGHLMHDKDKGEKKKPKV